MSNKLGAYTCDRCGKFCKDNDVQLDYVIYKNGRIEDYESFYVRLCHKCWEDFDNKWLNNAGIANI